MQITIEKRFNNETGPVKVQDTNGNSYKFWPTVKRGNAKVRNPVAEIIQAGGTYEVEVKTETNGNYTDTFITDAKVVGEAPQASAPAQQGGNTQQAGPQHRDYLIVSQVATNRAVDLVVSGQIKIDEIGKWAGKIAGVIYNLTTLSQLGQLEHDPFAE